MYQKCKINFKCGVTETLVGKAFDYTIHENVIDIACYEEYSCMADVEYAIVYNLNDINSIEFR